MRVARLRFMTLPNASLDVSFTLRAISSLETTHLVQHGRTPREPLSKPLNHKLAIRQGEVAEYTFGNEECGLCRVKQGCDELIQRPPVPEVEGEKGILGRTQRRSSM